jgi:hypothetical protein
MWSRAWLLFVTISVICVACDFPRPADVGDAAGADAPNADAPSIDSASADASVDGAVDSAMLDTGAPMSCTPDQPLRCDGGALIRCNSDGTAEVSVSCILDCNSAALRCNDVNPSNSLAPFLDMTASEPDFNLGTTAVINTGDGTVMVDGNPITIRSATLDQAPAPMIRVFIVHGLVTGAVTVTGSNALAVVSHTDVRIEGTFTASASNSTAGAGAFNDGSCTGHDGVIAGARGGCGGGGFGGGGSSGGTANNDDGTSSGGDGGTVTGNVGLVPLRGGCNSGKLGGLFGAGGGAIQLVSRSKITISGAVAANGSSSTGGGSGGGILLEAPIVEVAGAVVANGGAGAGGCTIPNPGENGRLDAMSATGGNPCTTFPGGKGGNGGARNGGPSGGASANGAGSTGPAYAGNGGGGVGRIRANTIAGGLHVTGVFSPNPSTGLITTR